MAVTVVNIGIMGVRMCERFVNVAVRMGLCWISTCFMGMLVMLVVNVPMTMLQPLMRVFVLMSLRQVKPHSDAHQSRRYQEEPADGFMQK